jgi:hypothetical protein
MEMRWAIWGRRTSIRERTSMIAVRGSMIAMRGSMIATRETMRTTLTSIRTVYYKELNYLKSKAFRNNGVNLMRPKRGNDGNKLVSIAENFVGSHCLEAFDVSFKTIIRTNDSLRLGAQFLDEAETENFQICLKYCCDTTLCDVAVWDDKVAIHMI